MNLFKKIKKNITLVTPEHIYNYKVNGIDATGAFCQTIVEAKNEAEARKKIMMKTRFTEARAYLDASDARDYSIHFMRIISVVRV